MFCVGSSGHLPVDQLGRVSEDEFEEVIREADAMNRIVMPDREC